MTMSLVLWRRLTPSPMWLFADTTAVAMHVAVVAFVPIVVVCVIVIVTVRVCP